MQALATYGSGLGMAFQLADDFLDYGGDADALGKNTGDDFREGKVTMPVILAFSRGDADAKAFWNRTVGKGDWTEDDLATAMTYVRETGALADTQKAARAEIDAATEALDVFGDSPMRTALRDVARVVVERQT